MKADVVVELYKMFTKSGIVIWFDGGWGVDSLLGRQTREHGDVDIVVQKKDLQKLREVLERKGYRDVPRDDTSDWNFVLGDESGHLIDIHVISFNTNGDGIYGPKEKGVSYPAYSFKCKGSINGFPVNCLSAEYQVESHTGYEIDENDIKDVTALCKKFNINLPREYS